MDDYYNHHSYYTHSYDPNLVGSQPMDNNGFDVDSSFELDDWIADVPDFSPFDEGFCSNPQQPADYAEDAADDDVAVHASLGGVVITDLHDHERINSGESGATNMKKGIKKKVAFRTKSDIEVLNDGFKWRKYGKKMVKDNPNPRNYYKCSIEGCPVKKRVERDHQDSRYVITTYEGIHNHEGTIIS